MTNNLEKDINVPSKGFQLTFPNGAILGFWKSFIKNKKSYDLMLCNGKDNCYCKVGNITDIDLINEVLWNDR